MNEEVKVKSIKKAVGSIVMPKKIEIGDPWYFQTGSGLDLTYSKAFRGKSEWSCELELNENIVSYPPDKYFPEGLSYNEFCFTLNLAIDDKMLDLLKNDKHYARQTVKSTDIAVDTAKYKIGVNKSQIIIQTGADGGVGFVSEYYTGKKLEAIVIESSISDYMGLDFDGVKKLLEQLFSCELKNIKQ